MVDDSVSLSRLRWLCRRGMRELDMVMLSYLDEYYAEATAEEQALFRQLLDMPDPELYGLLLGREVPDDPGMIRLIERLRV